MPVMVAKGWSDAQKRAYVVADNKLALNAGWDNELLALELGELGDVGFDLELTGFTDEEIKALMPVEVNEGLTDPDSAPAVQENPVTVLGDVWVMGNHRLMCGDSTSTDHLAQLTNGNLVDMWLTDPPYNVAYEGCTKDKLKIKNDETGDEHSAAVSPDGRTVAYVFHRRDDLRASEICVVDVATGAVRGMPPIAGGDQDHVYSGDDMRKMMLGESSDDLKRKTGLFTRIATKVGAATGATANLALVRNNAATAARIAVEYAMLCE